MQEYVQNVSYISLLIPQVACFYVCILNSPLPHTGSNTQYTYICVSHTVNSHVVTTQQKHCSNANIKFISNCKILTLVIKMDYARFDTMYSKH